MTSKLIKLGAYTMLSVMVLSHTLVSAQITETTSTSDPFANPSTTTTSTGGGDDPFAASPATTASTGSTATADPFASPTGTGAPTTTSADPFASSTGSNTTSTAQPLKALITQLTGGIVTDSKGTTFSIKVPKGIIGNQTSKALVQLQFCFLDGNNCTPVSSLKTAIVSENEKSKIASIMISGSDGKEMKLAAQKIITIDNGESIQLQKLPGETEGAVKLYNTSIEFGQYDSIPSDINLTMMVNPAQLEYSFEAEQGKPFARVILIDDATSQQTIIPVIYEGPKTAQPVTAPTPKPTTVSDVKKAETGIELYTVLFLAIAAVAAFGVMKKLED